MPEFHARKTGELRGVSVRLRDATDGSGRKVVEVLEAGSWVGKTILTVQEWEALKSGSTPAPAPAPAPGPTPAPGGMILLQDGFDGDGLIGNNTSFWSTSSRGPDPNW